MELTCRRLNVILLICWMHITVHANSGLSKDCPIAYPRHSTTNIKNESALPYLFGGIYARPECAVCRQKALWPIYCGRQSTGIGYYDRQTCSQKTVKNVIRDVLGLEDVGALTLTPCDLWKYLSGRTTWILGYAKTAPQQILLLMEAWDASS
jgi:hypothetical protein